MPRVIDLYAAPPELLLGKQPNRRVPESDQIRQRGEVLELLRRLRAQPGVILADEVGMGKTYVALAVAYCLGVRSPRGPAVVMVPPNLVDKWEQDLKAFCELYLDGWQAEPRGGGVESRASSEQVVRYGVARHSIELMRLLDDAASERCHVIFLAQGAMSRRQSDKWVRLALIAEALRRHARGNASRLAEVKRTIHRFLAQLVWAIGSQQASDEGEEIWNRLLANHPSVWKRIYNDSVRNQRHLLTDDPVPKSVVRAIEKIELRPLAEELKEMPIRSRGGERRVAERVAAVRTALRAVEEELWTRLLAKAQWRSPLLVMDEAHHLKNPNTRISRQLQAVEAEGAARTGDGALANSFDRMLFLTATPFQLGHRELVRILERFADVRWNSLELGDRESFLERLRALGGTLDESQRTAVALQRSWSRLSIAECGDDSETWWRVVTTTNRGELSFRQRTVLDAYRAAKRARILAEEALRPWVLRHNKGRMWLDTQVQRRARFEGCAILGLALRGGLQVPHAQLLPFFLAARSSVRATQDLLGEALSSSYEAFRETRRGRHAGKDSLDDDGMPEALVEESHAHWYLEEFDAALAGATGAIHPKVAATVRKVVDLWENGEKVLVFAFYRLTCRALRVHLSKELEQRIVQAGLRRLSESGIASSPAELESLVARVQNRFFDDADSPGRRAVNQSLEEMLESKSDALIAAGVGTEERSKLLDVMRRFLRVGTTLVRCFPLAELDSISSTAAIRQTLDAVDRSGLSWRRKLLAFVDFLADSCSSEERRMYIEAALRTQTGGIRVDEPEAEQLGLGGQIALANIQVATGETRRDQRARLMRAFNTPFFPDILVCSEVMGEGVDLQRFCRHVIHHDLAWNPSTIEQRTGRIDRLGCKAEGRHSIEVYLPYIAGSADERQFRVMSDRERWFRVVMGEDEVAKLIAPDSDSQLPLPEALAAELSFDLSLTRRSEPR